MSDSVHITRIPCCPCTAGYWYNSLKKSDLSCAKYLFFCYLCTMPIKIKLQSSDTELFCRSKWWGDPDLPADMDYPTAPAEEDDETFDYPLTFLCQIDCEDIGPLDAEGLLPHQGMFYVFAGIDEYLGYDSPWHNGIGLWDRKQVVVKYTKAINMETFRSAILVDDEDQPLTSPALKMTFEACQADEKGTCLLGNTTQPDRVPFLQLASGTAGLQFPGKTMLNLFWSAADHAKGNWKRIQAVLGGLA